MGRVIPFHTVFPNKTLLDLAAIPGWSTPAVRRRSLNEIADAFRHEAGCPSLEDVWDIATMAPNLGVVSRAPDPVTATRNIAKAVLGAASELGVRTWSNGNLTHVTAFNDVHAHRYFLRKGFPFRAMFGLEPMVYDSFESGEGMVAQPSWFALDEFVAAIRSAPAASYLDVLGENLRADAIL